MSKAASAQYAAPCPFCGAKPYKPCESIGTRRVTDTHAARIAASVPSGYRHDDDTEADR